MKTSLPIEIEMNCRAFSGERKAIGHRLLVSSLTRATGDVQVWDVIAGHYTSCHILGWHSRSIARGIAKRLLTA